jgi:hypothetical protein
VAQAVNAPLAQRYLPLVLIVALAALLAAGWLELRSRALPRRASPEVADQAQPIEAWMAAAPDGRVRLTRLYPDEGRQRFESQALRERFALDEGELFLLSREPALAGAAEVRDEHGIALGTLPAGEDGPVRALFSTPRGVRRGAAQEWILWGRAPHGSAAVWIEGARVDALEPARLPRGELRGPVAELVRERATGKNEAARSSEGRDGKQAAAQR